MARTCTTTLLSAKGQVEILIVAVAVVLVVVVIVDTSSTQSDAVQSRGGGGGKIDVIGFQFGGKPPRTSTANDRRIYQSLNVG